jgi:hypothetical protein
MPHNVRQHTRKTASGGTTTVRQHTRRGGDTKAAKPPRAIGQRIKRLFTSRRDARQPVDYGWAVEEPELDHRQTLGEALRNGRAAYTERKSQERGLSTDDTRASRQQPRRDRPEPVERPRTGPSAFERAEVLSEMLAGMRDWRSRPEPKPSPTEPMTPQMAKLLGTDTPEGFARYERGRAYREAGYDGPLDQDCRIPDPDDPAERETLSALASMEAWRRSSGA